MHFSGLCEKNMLLNRDSKSDQIIKYFKTPNIFSANFFSLYAMQCIHLITFDWTIDGALLPFLVDTVPAQRKVGDS